MTTTTLTQPVKNEPGYSPKPAKPLRPVTNYSLSPSPSDSPHGKLRPEFVSVTRGMEYPKSPAGRLKNGVVSFNA